MGAPQGAPRGGHLVGQEHGTVRELSGVSTGLLPHGNLLSQHVFTLEREGGREVYFTNYLKVCI